MGTNYYLRSAPCRECGHQKEGLHIGKSSAGWCFSLHVTDEIKSLEDWKNYIKNSDEIIYNEYEDIVSPVELYDIIENRSWDGDMKMSKKFLDDNYAIRGPNGLLRHKIGQYCIGHGQGTYDYIKGDFS